MYVCVHGLEGKSTEEGVYGNYDTGIDLYTQYVYLYLYTYLYTYLCIYVSICTWIGGGVH